MMSQYNQHQAPEEALPPPVMAYPAVPHVPCEAYSHKGPTEGYLHVIAPPPPVGYPTMEVLAYRHNSSHIETKTKGEGFWKGCVAAICCCWVLECCCV